MAPSLHHPSSGDTNAPPVTVSGACWILPTSELFVALPCAHHLWPVAPLALCSLVLLSPLCPLLLSLLLWLSFPPTPLPPGRLSVPPARHRVDLVHCFPPSIPGRSRGSFQAPCCPSQWVSSPPGLPSPRLPRSCLPHPRPPIPFLLDPAHLTLSVVLPGPSLPLTVVKWLGLPQSP